MIKNKSIQLKAALLLTVFGLNTLVGFACAIGLDMDFNTTYHKDAATESSIHIHADGKKHHHNPEPAKVKVHVHADGKKHEHKSEPVKPLHDKKETPKKESKDCCTDNVLKFQSLDKNLNQNLKIEKATITWVNILNIFSGFDFKVLQAPPKYIASYFHPPPNILIIIHRFQI
jgi:hypothetical protein